MAPAPAPIKPPPPGLGVRPRLLPPESIGGEDALVMPAVGTVGETVLPANNSEGSR
jgi:hypothetical protein